MSNDKEQALAVPSVRLTVSSREQILDSVLKDFTKNFLAQKEVLGTTYAEEHELVTAIDSEYIGVMTHLWHVVYERVNLEGVPKHLLSTAPFSVKIGDRVEQCPLKGFPGKPNAIDAVFEEDHKSVQGVFGAYDLLREYHSRLGSERKSFKSEVWTVLESVTTTRQLLEVWPAVKNFLPAHILNPEKGIQLPAKLISNLDEKLGIKP